MSDYKPWTTFEHRLASSNLTNADISRITGRSVNSVAGYRNRNDLDGNPKRWRPEEDLLLEYYPLLTIRDFVALLPGRTADTINSRMITLGIVETENDGLEWTTEDDSILETLTPKSAANRAFLRLLFRKTRTAVNQRLESKGITPADNRIVIPAKDQAKLLRLILTGKDWKTIREELVHRRAYLLKKQTVEFSQQLGVPVKGLK